MGIGLKSTINLPGQRSLQLDSREGTEVLPQFEEGKWSCIQ